MTHRYQFEKTDLARINLFDFFYLKEPTYYTRLIGHYLSYRKALLSISEHHQAYHSFSNFEFMVFHEVTESMAL